MNKRSTCPRCNAYLRPESIKGQDFEHCFRCGGSFLEKGSELIILGEPASSVYWKETEIGRLKSGKLVLCPKGHESLISYSVRYEQDHVEVDICSSCEGLWFDPEEGKKLFDIVLHAGQDKAASFNEKPGFKSYLFQAFSGFPVEAWNPIHQRPLLTLALMATLVCLFILQLSFPAEMKAFILYPQQFISGENTWTLISSGFLHINLGHLLGNLYFLYIFGDNVEDRLGRVRFALVYLSAVVFSGLFYIIASTDKDVGVLGASGAIAALMGIYIVLFPKVKLHFTLFFVPFRISAIWYLSFWLLFNILMMLAGEGRVAWSAHVGGFIFGIAAGYFFRFRSIKEYIESR